MKERALLSLSVEGRTDTRKEGRKEEGRDTMIEQEDKSSYCHERKEGRKEGRKEEGKGYPE